MTKFKVGDKVKILSGGCDRMVGKIVVIRNTRGYPYMVVFDECVHLLYPGSDTAIEATEKGYDYRKCWVYRDGELELVEEKEMENVKSLLKSGDIVVLKSGEKCKVFLDYETHYYGKGCFAFIGSNDFMSLSSYDDNLCNKPIFNNYSINKIYRPKADGDLMSTDLDDYKLVWERKEVKEMTMEEICKALGYDVKIKKEDK